MEASSSVSYSSSVVDDHSSSVVSSSTFSTVVGAELELTESSVPESESISVAVLIGSVVESELASSVGEESVDEAAAASKEAVDVLSPRMSSPEVGVVSIVAEAVEFSALVEDRFSAFDFTFSRTVALGVEASETLLVDDVEAVLGMLVTSSGELGVEIKFSSLTGAVVGEASRLILELLMMSVVVLLRASFFTFPEFADPEMSALSF